jgi:hypothetical protein
MSKKYPGGLITKTPVAPAGPFQDDAASGVWTLSQAAYWQEQGLWPIAGNSSGPSVIGEAFGGGFYAGQISTTGNGVADALHNCWPCCFCSKYKLGSGKTQTQPLLVQTALLMALKIQQTWLRMVVQQFILRRTFVIT